MLGYIMMKTIIFVSTFVSFYFVYACVGARARFRCTRVSSLFLIRFVIYMIYLLVFPSFMCFLNYVFIFRTYGNDDHLLQMTKEVRERLSISQIKLEFLFLIKWRLLCCICL